VKRFKNVLVVATDGDMPTSLLETAVDLATRNEASITLFDVLKPLSERRRFLKSTIGEIDLGSMIAETRAGELQDVVSRVTDYPIEVEVAFGTKFVAVIRRVVARGHDLVMASPDLSKRRLGLAGSSTTMHLLRKSPVPVWVDAGRPDQGPDVAVALGPIEPGHEHGALNVALLELGSSLAARRGGSLHVIHAWRLEGESLLRSNRVGTSDLGVDAMVDEARREATAGLKTLLDQVAIGEVPVVEHLEKGEASDVVSSAVARSAPGVVVMGTLARAGLKGVIMGNTAERVLADIDTSVLAVKPPGFTSPVIQ
jgi:nucleotide-binding universal stress UspA family protein